MVLPWEKYLVSKSGSQLLSRTYVDVKGSDLLSVELDTFASVGRGVVGRDHGVGLGPAM